MIYATKILNQAFVFVSVALLCLGGTSMSFGSEGHKQEKGQTLRENTASTHLPPSHRIIYGTVEGVNEATIKVDAGEVGEMTPRYLELEKLGEKTDSIKQGDRLKITVDNTNKVVDYQLADETQ